MKRPLFLCSISLIAGIMAAQAGNSFLFVALSVLIPVFFTIILHNLFPGKLYIFICAILFFILGACEYLYVDRLNTNKFKEFGGREIAVKGFIASEPDIRELKVLYVIKTEEISSAGQIKRVKGKILLTTLKNGAGNIYGYGRSVEITGRLDMPKSRRNPGGFDYRRNLAKSGISATIFASGDNIRTGIFKNGNVLVKTGLAVRYRIIDVINKSLPAQQAGLLNGMLIGYREGLSKDVQNAFSDSGLAHVMAVSGMNIAFIVLPLVFLFKKLRLRQKTANTAIIIILIFFVYITGFSPSVLRAVIMAITILTGQMIRRETDVIASLSLAAILLLVYNPYTLYDIGFQLSFAATMSLVVFYKNIKERLNNKYMPRFITETAAVTISAQIGVLPVTAFYFNKVSVISVLSNVIVVPLVEVVTILGFIMAILGQIGILLSQMIGYVNCTILTFILLVTKISAGLPFAAFRVVTPPILLIIIYYILVLFIFWYKPVFKIKIKPVYYTVVLSIAVVITCISILLPGNLEVVFIDVGEGDATFVRTYTGKTVLIDAGGYSSKTGAGANLGETVIIPFLLDFGVSKLDLVIATHGHTDHIQGLLPVLKDFAAGALVIPDIHAKKEFDGLIEVSKARGIPVKMCKKGDFIKLDDKTFFRVLHPKKGSDENNLSLNNGSLVLKLHYVNTDILFTGDIEEEAENILADDMVDVKAGVIKVAHHGSENSTKDAFLKLVKPKAAVISVGKNNFGHPSRDVLERLKLNGVQVFRTDEDGAVILISDGKRIKFRKIVYGQVKEKQ